MDSVAPQEDCPHKVTSASLGKACAPGIQVLRSTVSMSMLTRPTSGTRRPCTSTGVMEWCRGGPTGAYLKKVVGPGGRYAENTVASVVRGALRGLHHIHGAGVIHRDIKAGNIMFSDPAEDAVVKVGDLGLAVFYDLDVVDTNDLVGTPWYMSPEALRKRYCPRSDVWSLGVMTYQMLSGRMPFNDRSNPMSPSLPVLWNEILTKDPDFGGEAWDGICAEAKDFVGACLIKGYEDRIGVEECLDHPWLKKTDCEERFTGPPLLCQPFAYEEATAMDALSITG